MPISVTITLNSIVGTPGPFNLYSCTGLTCSGTPFETDVPLSGLTSGYVTNLTPNGTTIVKIVSTGGSCSYEIVKSISGLPTPTPTPTSTPIQPTPTLNCVFDVSVNIGTATPTPTPTSTTPPPTPTSTTVPPTPTPTPSPTETSSFICRNYTLTNTDQNYDRNYSYEDCLGVTESGTLGPERDMTFCAKQGTISTGGSDLVDNGTCVQ